MPTLFLIVGNTVHRDSLASTLAAAGFVVVAALGSGEQSLSAIREVSPDVVLLDLPAHEGLPLLKALRYERPPVPAVVVLGHAGEETESWRWAHEGASGLLLATEPVRDLVTAIHSAAVGATRYPPAVAAVQSRQLPMYSPRPLHVSPPMPLTKREREIVSLIDEGLSNKEISATLGIHLSTVKNHVHHLLEKLKARRRSEAAAEVGGRRKHS